MTVNRNPNFIPRKNYFGVSPGMIRQLLIQHGLDQTSVEPVAMTMHRLYSKFGADERLNYDVIEKALVSGRGRAATVVVAAHDAPEDSKANAQYVCTGIEDHLVIQEAVNYVQTLAMENNVGGRVLFTEGEFLPADSINFGNDTTFPYIEFFGYGNATTFLANFGFPGDAIFVATGYVYGCRFSNFTIDVSGTDAINLSGSVDGIEWMVIDNMWIDADNGIVGDVDAMGAVDFCRIVDNYFSCNTNAIDLHAVSIDNGGIAYLTIANNIFNNGAVLLDMNIAASAYGYDVRLTGNVFEGNVSIKNITYLVMSGNNCDTDLTIEHCTNLTLTGNIIGITQITDTLESVIDSNKFLSFVTITDATSMIFNANRIPAGHPMLTLDGVWKSIISNNSLQNNDNSGSQTGIAMISCDDNLVTTNMVRKTAGANVTGITIDASCENNMVVNNDCFGCNLDVNDSGTATVLAGNRF